MNIIQKIKLYLFRKKLKKFNTYVECTTIKYDFASLDALFDNKSFLRDLLGSSSGIKFCMFTGQRRIFLDDYYYHTHPTGAWLTLAEVIDNKICISDEIKCIEYQRFLDVMFNSYYEIFNNINDDLLTEYEIFELNYGV